MNTITDTEIIERYFKVQGWWESGQHWVRPGQTTKSKWAISELPKILTDFPAFKQHVLEVMMEEGYSPRVIYPSWYWWSGSDLDPFMHIENGNILYAAVISATRYFEGKK